MNSNWNTVLSAAKSALRHLIPPPDILPSEWAEKNVIIPLGNAIPGPIRFDNAPYQRGMLDVIKEPGVRRIDYMTGAQLGKTTVMQCIASYFIDHEPKSQIFVQPTEGDTQTFRETKLNPMLDANPKIKNKLAKPRGREGANNSRLISYSGGWLMFSWAKSPNTLRGRSAPVTHADEVDAMDVTKEGDPVNLLQQRSATFGDQQLSIRSSTPTIRDASRIETGFLAGDQRRFYVACPDCGQSQYFRWENVTWHGRRSTGIKDAAEDLQGEHDPDSALYACDHCGSLWNDGQRIAAIRGAEAAGLGWIAAKPFSGHASFHAPEMLSTMRRLKDIVRSYLDKLRDDDLQTFINVSLAETYEEPGEKADPNSLLARVEEYPAPVPMGGVYLTAGIDMQIDRLECEVVAWGPGEESWSVGYFVLWGDPLGNEVWFDLDNLLAEEWRHETGVMLKIGAACLDTGGTSGYTQAAYEYARGKEVRKLFAVKGIAGWDRPIVEKPMRKQSGRNARKVALFLVGADQAKAVVMRRLANPVPGPGYCHFPSDYDEKYFRGLTAEKLVTSYRKGQPVREWTKPDKERNEPLDCRAYALAALKIMQPNLRLYRERLMQKAESLKDAAHEIPQVAGDAAENDNQTSKVQKPKRRNRRAGWVNNF